MLLYKSLPKEYSGGLVGLNIFSGSVGMLAISKLSAIMYMRVSIRAAYGFGALLTLAYIICYLLYVYTTGTRKRPDSLQRAKASDDV